MTPKINFFRQSDPPFERKFFVYFRFFRAVGPHFWCDFMLLIDVIRSNSLKYAIKSHQKCGPTGRKKRFLGSKNGSKGGQKNLLRGVTLLSPYMMEDDMKDFKEDESKEEEDLGLL